MDRRPGADAITARRGNAARLFGYDIFISFALGAPPRGSLSYASDLARRLREEDFTVFFSEDEAPAGSELDATLRQALHRSRILVVVANRGTLVDPRWVRVEVEEFRRRHPDRRVIPISIDGALRDTELAAACEPWLRSGTSIWLDETTEAGATGVVSEPVLARLRTAPHSVRANTRWRWTVGSAFAALLAVTAAALWFADAARVAERRARSGQLAAESQLAVGDDNQRALLLAREAWLADHGAEAERALYLALRQPMRRLVTDDGGEWNSVAYGAGGVVAAAAAKSEVRRWRLDRGATVALPSLVTAAPVRSIAFAADGRRLAVAQADGEVSFWDAGGRPAGAPLRHSVQHTLSTLAFDASGRMLAVAGLTAELKQAFVVWDVAAAKPCAEPIVVPAKMETLAMSFSPDGRWLAATVDDTVRVWNWATGQMRGPPITTRPATRPVTAMGTRTLSFIDNDVLAFDGPGYEATLWDLNRSAAVEPSLAGQRHRVEVIAYAADVGIVATGSKDGAVRLWHRASQQPWGGALAGHDRSVSAFAFDPSQERLLSAGRDGRLFEWRVDPRSARLRAPPPAQDDGPGPKDPAVAFDREGRMLAWSSEDGLLHWRPAVGGREITRAPVGRATGIFAVAGDGTIALQGLGAGPALLPMGAAEPRCTMPAAATAVRFSPDGRLLLTTSTGAPAGTLLWRSADCAPLGRVVAPGGGDDWPAVADFSADGRDLVVAVGGDVRRTPVAGFDGKAIATGGWAAATDIAADRGGTMIATARGGGLVRFRRGDGNGIDLSGPHGRAMVRALAFSPDGRWLASVGDDGRVALWDTTSLQPIGPAIDAGQGPLSRVAFAADGRHLLTGASHGPPVIWEIGGDAWAERACSVVERNLDPTEWRRFLGDVQYRKVCPAIER